MKIPKKQSDIKLSTYLKYNDYYNNLTDKQKLNTKVVMKQTIKIFYEIKELEYNSKPYNQIIDMFQIIQNILNTPQKLIPIIEVDGVEFGITPDFRKLTFGELVDLDTDDILKQICILYRPIIKRKGEKYLIKDYDADISSYELFKEKLTLDIYNGFISFFLHIQKNFVHTIQRSMETEKQQVSRVN